MAHLLKNADGHLAKATTGHLVKATACATSHCWVRWKLSRYCDETPDLLEVVEVVCLENPPEYAGDWVQTNPMCAPCVWRYDQLLDDTCTTEEDCPEPPETPDIALPDDECCTSICVLSWVVSCTIDVGCGTVTEDGVDCVSGEDFADMIIGRWYMIGVSGDTCTYRYNATGACCEGGIEFCVFPPEAPMPPTGFEESCAACRDYVPDMIQVEIDGNVGVCRATFCPDVVLGSGCYSFNTVRGNGSLDGSWTMTGASDLGGGALQWIDVVAVSASVSYWLNEFGGVVCTGCDDESDQYCSDQGTGTANLSVILTEPTIEAGCGGQVQIATIVEPFVCRGFGIDGFEGGVGGSIAGECGTCCSWAEDYELSGVLQGATCMFDGGTVTVTILDCPDELP